MTPLTILFNTYPVAFDCPGGGEVQLLKYMEELERLGVRVLRYGPVEPQTAVRCGRCRALFLRARRLLAFPHLCERRTQAPSGHIPDHLDRQAGKIGLDEIGFLLRMADHILPNSRAECSQLASLFNLAPTLFTPIVNGVDEIFFTPAEPALFREHFGIRSPFVLCMGNIEERKINYD